MLEIDIRPCQKRERSDVDGLNSYIGPRKEGPRVTQLSVENIRYEESLSHEGSMQVVCIAHSSTTRVNSLWKHLGRLGLGFLKEAACMTREYLGHPQNI